MSMPLRDGRGAAIKDRLPERFGGPVAVHIGIERGRRDAEPLGHFSRDRRGDFVQAGPGGPDDLLLQYTTRRDRVEDGQSVVTAGTTSSSNRYESAYPPGIPIGEVTRVDDPGTDSQKVHIRPFADLHRLEFVQILTSRANGNRP